MFRSIKARPGYRRLESLVERVNRLESEITRLSDSELRAKTLTFRKRYRDGESLDALLPEAFAAVREAAKRLLGQRHVDVQMIGGAVLHQGKIAEMATGEGKTLTAVLSAYLNALSGDKVHVVTVNDYTREEDFSEANLVLTCLGDPDGERCVVLANRCGAVVDGWFTVAALDKVLMA
jgi:preprotein translocase subunit SecA